MKSTKELKQEIKLLGRRPRQTVGIYDPREQAGQADMVLVNVVLKKIEAFEKKPQELFERDVANEFAEMLHKNAKPIHVFVKDGNTKELVVPLDLALANYANTEHVLNKLKEILGVG